MTTTPTRPPPRAPRPQTTERTDRTEDAREKERVEARAFALRVAAAYLAFGAAWVLLSDLVVNSLVHHHHIDSAQTLKGVSFIALSSLLLYVLVRTLASHRGRVRVAERAAEERDAWVGALVEGSSVGQAVLDRELRFVHLNERLAQMHGVPVGDHLGRTIAEILGGPAGDELFADHRRVFETGVAELDIPTEAFEPPHEGPEGQWRKSVFPIRDRHGVVVGVGVNVRDVSEEVGAERDRRSRMETLEMVVRHLPVMVAFLDADGRPGLVNPEWERVIGWRGEDLATRDLLAELYPDAEERARVQEMIDRSDGTWARFETRARSGRIVPTEWTSVRLPDGRVLGIGLDLSQERRRERALERTEARYRHLVEMIPGVVYRNEIDAEDPTMIRCVYIAPQVEALLGYTPQEWYDDPDLWIRIVHPDDRAQVLEANDAADLTGEVTFEYRAIHRDGGIVWIHDEGMFVRGDDHQPGYWQGVMVDTTAQRVADAGIHELAESLRSIVEAAPVAILVLDPDSRVRLWNPAAERIFGWAAEETIGRRYPTVDEERWHEHMALRARVLAGETLSGVPLKRLRKDGSEIDVEVWTAALREHDGSIAGIVSVFEDVSERRRVETELVLRSEMLDTVSEAVIGSDETFTITYWNRGAERLYGWTAEETIGRPVADFVRAEDPDDRGEEIRAGLLLHGTWTGEASHRRKDGSIVPVESITVARTRSDGSRFFLSVNRDITERTAAERALESRAAQQAAVASLGLEAMEGESVDALLRRAVTAVAETLDVPLATVLEIDPDDDTSLLLRAGVGWTDGYIGESRVDRRKPSFASYTLSSEMPVIADDIGRDPRFPAPPRLVAHGVTSGVSSVIYGARRPYGVVEALSREPRAFSGDDVRFLQGVAAIVGLAIERSRADRALEQAEARYRGLVERGPGIVYLHDTSAAPAFFTYVSPQVVDLFGYPREAWTDDPRFWISVVHEDDRERLIAADTHAIERGVDLDIEYRVVRSDGSVRWMHDHATLIRDPDGEPLFRQGLMVDVTERHEAEAQRRIAVERQLHLATRLELMHAIDREVRAANTVRQVCAATLGRVRALVPADFASVGVIDHATGLLDFPAMVDTEEARLVESEPTMPDAETLAMLREDVLRIDDLLELESSSPYVEGARAQGLRSLRSFAMWAEDRHVGVLIFGARTPRAFGEEDEDIGREVASLLGIAISQKQLRDELAVRAEEFARLADERQRMLRRIVTTQEAERERVALELHDGLGQILTSISLFAMDLESVVPSESQPRARRVNELVRRAISDSRKLVWSLRPPELERLGLVPALRRLAEETTRGDLTVDLHEEIGDLRIDPEAEAVVYRVVQEAVNNSLKHAAASAISILLRRRDGVVSTIVEDDGRGFAPDAVPARSGLGLIGMRERAELVGGELIVESAVEAGTRVRLEVPVSTADGET